MKDDWLKKKAVPARTAHQHSAKHRTEIEASETVGCFYCCEIYSPIEIDEWWDEDSTAVCPRCGIDSVIGSKSGYPIEKAFLEDMRIIWFGDC